MVIFQGKNFIHSLSKGEIPSTLYEPSDSGWMDHELFVSVTFSCTCCIKSTSLSAIRWPFLSFYVRSCQVSSRGGCNNLVSPSSHSDTQLLDTSCFGPLKTYWAQLCHEYRFANPGCVITKYQFSVFSQARSKGMTINKITSGFRNTGIYPFNPQAILCKVSPKFQSTKDTPQSSSSIH